MAKKTNRKAYSREERRMHIITALAVNVQSGGDGRLTAKDIANVLHMEASTHLRIMLNDLVVEKVLAFDKQPDPGIAGFRRVYYLHPDSVFHKEINKARKGAGIKDKESKEDRDKRLMAAISKTNGQMSFVWEGES